MQPVECVPVALWLAGLENATERAVAQNRIGIGISGRQEHLSTVVPNGFPDFAQFGKGGVWVLDEGIVVEIEHISTLQVAEWVFLKRYVFKRAGERKCTVRAGGSLAKR